EYYNELTAQIFKLDLTDKIIFIGFTDNPYIYMKFADCFVLPSRNEGLPNVVIESLFLGTPVAVTASVPVIRRIVRDGIDGFIVDVDDAEGLADAMVKSVNLGRVSSSYKSATREDFEKLFLNI
ncbi:MAG: glycosyltransferase, partial [Flavobacteriales bacterium]